MKSDFAIIPCNLLAPSPAGMTIRSVKHSSVFWNRKNSIVPNTNPSRILEEASVVSCFSTTPNAHTLCFVIVHPMRTKQRTSSVSTKAKNSNDTLLVRKHDFSVFCLQNETVLTFHVSSILTAKRSQIRWYITDSEKSLSLQWNTFGSDCRDNTNYKSDCFVKSVWSRFTYRSARGNSTTNRSVTTLNIIKLW